MARALVPIMMAKLVKVPEGNLRLHVVSMIGDEAETVRGLLPAMHLQSMLSVWMAVLV